MRIPRKSRTGRRLTLGGAVAVAVLGAGGIAYAVGNDPAPETGFATIEDGRNAAGTDAGRDCPEKGSGQGQQAQPEQQPSQPEQTQPEQQQPEQQPQPDPRGDA